MRDIHEILKEYWGYDGFRPQQEEIIRSVLEGKDTLALMPTGGGKSICFQVPALAQEGICLVISPLIALMKDQVENLKKRGVLAAAIYSGQSRREIVQILKNTAYGPYKFLYVSPERIETAVFREYLPALNLNLIAVDESHCISQWGYDFRPSYLRIAALRREVPHVPVMAVTASATATVQQDICDKLEMKEPKVFRQSFSRPNLSFSVFNTPSKISRMTEVIRKVPGTSIVYCKSRKRTVEIAGLLQMQGISSAFYHAGLNAEERSIRQQDWIENKTRTIVCTNAFGMGIDKPDVRLVVHVDVPDCLENYYQEAGRAGRDGKKAYAVLLYNDKDLAEIRELESKRYPSFEQIKTVYHALVNHLQIPSYTGDETGFDFNFEQFAANFKLDTYTSLYALKAMEQDGWFQLNEKTYTPSRIAFTTSKETLEHFQAGHPDCEPLLTTLLRTYSGIFDFPVPVSENLLARLTGKSEEETRDTLKRIEAFGIISYHPKNESGQVYFRKHRVPANEFRMEMPAYEKRKLAFRKRVEKMTGYTQTIECRSRYISRYFGDEEAEACGICDHCLNKKSSGLSGKEFERIEKQIADLLQKTNISPADLINKLQGVQKEKAWKVIEFLQAENRLVLKNGLISLAP